jgi:diketogulonate reductase-like aldo/keto reductase
MKTSEENMSNISRRKSLNLMTAGVCTLLFANFTNERIIMKAIPSTGEKLPVIGLGTWQTFDKHPAEYPLLKEVLTALRENGGTVIDSSPMYGRSEKVVGDLVEQLNYKDKFFMATKVWTNGRDAGIRQMQESMKLMKSPKMDLMQIHNLVDWQTHLKTLRSWKEEGKIRYIGITHYHSGAYEQVEKVINQENLDFLQINYSITSREAEKKILPLAKEKGIAVLINQPFDSGNLFRMTKGKNLPEWADEYQIKTWAQYFLKFIVSHPSVTCAIPGTSKANHLLDNMGAAFGKLPDENNRKKMIDYFKSL